MSEASPGEPQLESRPPSEGWWTRLVCAYLLIWIPMNYAAEVFGTLPSLDMRGGAAIVELAFHGAVSLAAATAGWMLLSGTPAGPRAAAVAIVAAAAASIQSVFWTVLPRDVAPGQALPLAGVTLAVAAFWLLILRRAGR